MPPFILRGRRRKEYLPSVYQSDIVSESISPVEHVEMEKEPSMSSLTTNLKPDVIQAINRVEGDISEQIQSLFTKENDLDAFINRKILTLGNPSLNRPILCGIDLRFALMYISGPSDYNSTCHGLPFSVEMKFLCSSFTDQLKDSNLVSPICGSRLTPFEKFLTILDSIRIDFDTGYGGPLLPSVLYQPTSPSEIIDGFQVIRVCDRDFMVSYSLQFKTILYELHIDLSNALGIFHGTKRDIIEAFFIYMNHHGFQRENNIVYLPNDHYMAQLLQVEQVDLDKLFENYLKPFATPTPPLVFQQQIFVSSMDTIVEVFDANVAVEDPTKFEKHVVVQNMSESGELLDLDKKILISTRQISISSIKLKLYDCFLNDSNGLLKAYVEAESIFKKIQEKIDVFEGKKSEIFCHPRIQKALERYLTENVRKKKNKSSLKNSPDYL